MSPIRVHAICTYFGQWLPGDPRGWRSRNHRRHSSGDYKSPPTAGEHAGLHRFARASMGREPVRLDPSEQSIVGSAFVAKLETIECEVLAACCGATHLHILFATDGDDATPMLGRAKQYSSHLLKSRPGKIWGEGAKIVRVGDDNHARNVIRYINAHAMKDGAWVWQERDRGP